MLTKLRFLNSNAIKLVAAFTMLIDHMGLMLFDDEAVFRIIGRLAMPLFAFAVAEGCHYTKNKYKHFGLLFGLAVICQAVYAVFAPEEELFSILFAFSFATLMIYALQYVKKSFFEGKVPDFVLAVLLFVLSVVITNLFCRHFVVDYGFYGCLLPVFAALPDFRAIQNKPKWLEKIETLPVRVLFFGAGLLLMIAMLQKETTSDFAAILPYHALALVPLFLYNGKKGKLNTKYFFYIFYPLHLALLQGVVFLLP